jgi:hypothetical protein
MGHHSVTPRARARNNHGNYIAHVGIIVGKLNEINEFSESNNNQIFKQNAQGANDHQSYKIQV